MNGFDFGKIGDIVSNVMDTDYIDIKRDVDGSLVEVYSNIPCHIAYVSIDNPDAKTIDIKPIIQGITLHFPLWVDVRNNDFVIAKKIGSDGSIEGLYSGRCGNPVVSMGRKKVFMEMGSTEPEEPTPVPPANPHSIFVSYMEGTNEIKESSSIQIEEGDSFTMSAPRIDGYDCIGHVLDGVGSSSTSVSIQNVEDDHDVAFLYEIRSVSDTFRFLVKGLYTKNDGSLANGWHSYKSVAIDSISQDGDEYTITCDDVSYEHEDNGKILAIEKNTLLILYPMKTFVRVDSSSVSNDKITFVATRFEPTQEQMGYYESEWYE